MRLRFAIVIATLAAAAVAVAVPAAAQKVKRPKPACGIKYLPLVEGNWWTYEPVNQPPAGPPAAQLKVEVLEVETEGKTTTIVMKETYREVEYEVIATCSAAGLVLPPESFFFAGEPGGVANMTIENFTHKGTSFPIKLKPGAQWLEEITFDVLRGTTEGVKVEHEPAKVELERLTTVVWGQQMVDTAIQTYRTTPIEFQIVGRGLIGEKSSEIPVRDKGFLWFTPLIGLARVREVSAREWQLIDSNLAPK